MSLLGRFLSRADVPVYIQTDACECGVMALAMVAASYGNEVDLREMRRRHMVSTRGVSIQNMMDIAATLGLAGRPLKLDLAGIKQLSLPCVLHWDFIHFVVLVEITERHAVVHDPAVGRRFVDWEEFSRAFTGVALELQPLGSFQRTRKKVRTRVRDLLNNVVGLRRSIAHILFISLCFQLCALVSPFLLQALVDTALVSSDQGLVVGLGVGFALLALFQAAIFAIRGLTVARISLLFNYQWFSGSFAHLLRLPPSYFESRSLGDIISRFGSIQVLQKAITSQIAGACLDLIIVALTLGCMIAYSGSMSLISIAAITIYAGLRYGIYSRIRRATSEQIVHAAKQNTHFLESIKFAITVRLFGGEQQRHTEWLNLLSAQYNAEYQLQRYSTIYQTGISLLISLERIAVPCLGVILISSDRLTLGMLFAFIAFKEQFIQRAAALIDNASEFRLLRLHAERAGDLLFAEPDPLDTYPVDIAPLDSRPGFPGESGASVEFRNVSFRYSEIEDHVLEDVSFTIPAGQFVAVVGESGSGKTTLAKLALGILRPTSGQILVQGKTIEQLGRNKLREAMSAVMQSEPLLSGTVLDNITFFDPNPDMQKVRDCAAGASITDEIEAMPMGYYTLVGDLGSGLSGGQVQRIAIARALYRNPKILILDEATSHLDMRNEKKIGETIAKFNLTRITIAHRPETIVKADRVIVLHQGKVRADDLKVARHEPAPV